MMFRWGTMGFELVRDADSRPQKWYTASMALSRGGVLSVDSKTGFR
jgi:hypothetical protein